MDFALKSLEVHLVQINAPGGDELLLEGAFATDVIASSAQFGGELAQFLLAQVGPAQVGGDARCTDQALPKPLRQGGEGVLRSDPFFWRSQFDLAESVS